MFDTCYASIRDLAVDQHGVVLLKKVMSVVSPLMFAFFTERALSAVLDFVNNQYGNYLMQYIVERASAGTESEGKDESSSSSNAAPGSPQSYSIASNVSSATLLASLNAQSSSRDAYHIVNIMVFQSLKGNFARLSKQKFSSNVVEKCLRVGAPELRFAICDEIVNDASAVTTLLLDQVLKACCTFFFF